MDTKKINAISTAILLFGLAICAFTQKWWPAILLVLAISLFVRGFLKKHYGEAIIHLIIFGGLYLYFQHPNVLPHEHFLPVILTILAIVVLLKEFAKRKW
jgi:hypothetical protein